MLIGRFIWLVPMIAVGGTMVRKASVPESAGTFPTTGGLFVGLMAAAVIVVSALTFFPVYALGPIVEHFLMHANTLF
jgi:K+-transporting ATPase ATPase A chain